MNWFRVTLVKNLDLVRAEVMEKSGYSEDGPDQVLVPLGYS